MRKKFKENFTAFGARAKAVRKELNLTLSEMFEKTQFAQSIISEVENGKRYPSSIYLYALCEKFNVNINYILTGKGDMFMPGKYRSLENLGEDREKRDKLLFYLGKLHVTRYQILTEFARIKKAFHEMQQGEGRE